MIQHSAPKSSIYSTDSGDSVCSLQLKLEEQRQVNQTMAEFLEQTYTLQVESRRAEVENLERVKRKMKQKVQEIRDQTAAELAALEAEETKQRSEISRHNKRRTR